MIKKAGILCININESNFSKSKILLVQGRETSKWSIPKGSIETTDFTFIDGAYREFFEETGIMLDTNRIKKSYIFIDTIIYIYHADFEFDIEYEKIKDKNEIAKIKWLEINEIEKINRNRGLSNLYYELTKTDIAPKWLDL